MERSRKKVEDQPVWLNPFVHVWRNKAGDITVVNLRDVNESMKVMPAPTKPASKVEMKSATFTQSPPPPMPPTPLKSSSQPEALSTLLAKLQGGANRISDREAKDDRSRETVFQQPASLPLSVAGERRSASTQASPPAVPSAASSQPQSTPPATGVTASTGGIASHNPVFPEPSPSASNNFEFISGTNIPGQGLVPAKKPPPENPQTLALFHDPVWGDAFGAPSVPMFTDKERKSRPIFDIYGDGKSNPAAASSLVPAPTTTSSSVTSVHGSASAPPGATMAPSPTPFSNPQLAPIQFAGPAGLPMAPGATPLPHPTAIAGGYPVYGVPMPFVAPSTFGGNLMAYNTLQYFPLAPSGMTVAQQPKPLPGSIMMTTSPRPGTNVEAMPFVPGSGQGLQ